MFRQSSLLADDQKPLSFPRRAETALRLKKKVEIKIAVQQNGTKGLSRVIVKLFPDSKIPT